MHVLMLVVGLGFVVSLVVAWAYELTPEGIKRESEVDRAQSVTHHTAKKLHYVTLGAIALLIIMLLADRFMPEGDDGPDLAQAVEKTEPAVAIAVPDPTAPTPLARGVAVLPFANLSEDPNNAFFAGGVHEDILTNLSRIADLRVISRTSMLKIAEQGLDIREIGKQLNVSHILEGSVRRSGDQVRVTVQLIDATNDDHLWADNYDRKLDDIFAIQSEVAQKIAAQLETELSPELAQRLAEVPTQNTQAYDLYLKARELARTWLAAEGFRKMRPLLEQAVALDPNFMDAQVMLAEVYGRLVWTGADPEGVYREKAKIVTDRILQQWPDRPESDIAEGNYHYTVERDYQAALYSFQKALLFMPNDTELLIAISSSYKRLGQFALGLPVITRAESLDPEHPIIGSEKTFHLVGTGQYEAAVAYAREFAAKLPDDMSTQATLASYTLSLFGNKSEYLKIIESVRQKSPLMVTSDPLALRMLMEPAELDQQISWLNKIRDESDFWTATTLGIQIAELLNLAGREEESRQIASTTLASIDDRLARNLPLGGNSPEFDYATFAYLACLADDNDAFRLYTAKSESVTLISIDMQEQTRVMLAQAMAECGDVQILWDAAKEKDADFYSGVTKWTLALDPLYQHYFADIPEYQVMVETLQNNKDAAD
jgi:TolB-like protein